LRLSFDKQTNIFKKEVMMKNVLPPLIVVVAMISAPVFAADPVPRSVTTQKSISILLAGSKGKAAGDGWQSAYLNLVPRRDFRVGDRLKIRLLGSAKHVLVRFLPDGTPQDKNDGIEGGIRVVNSEKILEITLATDHFDISQISVHAGHFAWETDLGSNNGTVTLVSIEYIKAATK
jgi:hypothetical protein